MADPKLYILSEQFKDKVFELTAEQYSIGRIDENDIQIADPTVSSHHCVLKRQPNGTYQLIDNNSTNGTTQNDQKLEPNVPAQLNNGDILLFGGVELMYEHKNTDSTQTTIRTAAVIDLNSAQEHKTKRVTANMRNLGKQANSHTILDLKTRNQQNKLMLIILGIMVLGAIGVAIKVMLSVK